MEMLVYTLCALASLLCAGLLYRAYRVHPTRLLLWSAMCFAGLAINNMILCLDFALGPQVDLSIVRHTSVLISMTALIYGLMWEVV